MDTFANRLKKAMQIRNITQSELCQRTKIPKSAMSQYLSGKFNAKQKRTAIIAKTLNVSETWLMGYDAPIDKETKTSIITDKPVQKTKPVPIVGDVACGNPIYAEENILEYIPVLESDNVDFALYAKGDSMNNCKIDDGDIIYVRSQPVVNNGEIAVVLIDDEATVKRFYDYGDKVVLRPDSTNPKHEEQVYEKKDHNILIQGKVVFIKTFIY